MVVSGATAAVRRATERMVELISDILKRRPIRPLQYRTVMPEAGREIISTDAFIVFFLSCLTCHTLSFFRFISTLWIVQYFQRNMARDPLHKIKKIKMFSVNSFLRFLLHASLYPTVLWWSPFFLLVFSFTGFLLYSNGVQGGSRWQSIYRNEGWIFRSCFGIRN